MSRAQAEAFYEEHRNKEFFSALVDFITEGMCVVAVLEGESAVARTREIVGATNPAQAAKGTVRARFGSSTTRNAVHASDSLQSAAREIAFFFPQAELT